MEYIWNKLQLLIKEDLYDSCMDFHFDSSINIGNYISYDLINHISRNNGEIDIKSVSNFIKIILNNLKFGDLWIDT